MLSRRRVVMPDRSMERHRVASPGRTRSFDEAGEALLDSLLSQDPLQHGFHSTGWRVAMLRAHLEKAAYKAAYSVSERTIRRTLPGVPCQAYPARRTLHKLGWRWKRPKYVLGRPDPDYEQKSEHNRAGKEHAGTRRRSLVRRPDDFTRVSSFEECMGQARGGEGRGGEGRGGEGSKAQ
jgi:hypothetical protein